MFRAIIAILLTAPHCFSGAASLSDLRQSLLSDPVVRHAEVIQQCMDGRGETNLAACVAIAALGSMRRVSPSEVCAAEVDKALRCVSKYRWPRDINLNSLDASLVAELGDDFDLSAGNMESVKPLIRQRAGPRNHTQAERGGEEVQRSSLMDVYSSYEVLHAFVQLLAAKVPPLRIGEAVMPGDQVDFFSPGLGLGLDWTEVERHGRQVGYHDSRFSDHM